MHTNLQSALASIPLGGLRYFDFIGSTNDEALAWIREGVMDSSLVIADEQIMGRGRAGRRWVTPRGTALAFSLILRHALIPSPTLFTGLGAVALVDALQRHGLSPQIKWPNDVLLNEKKVAGILAEAVWAGNALDAVVLGMGVNVLAGSNPPDHELLFPATNLETELGHPVEREGLLGDILSAVVTWRQKMFTGELVNAWEENLAFRSGQVQVSRGSEEPLIGRVDGLGSDGSLRLSINDKIVTVQFGEIHLRPAV